MACSFPTAITTVDEFLAPLNMERYAETFAGLSVEAIKGLTDSQLKEMGVAIKGHRARILMGVETLVAGKRARLNRLADERHEQNTSRERILQAELERILEEERILKAETALEAERLEDERRAAGAPTSSRATSSTSRESNRVRMGTIPEEDGERSVDAALRRRLAPRIILAVALVLALIGAAVVAEGTASMSQLHLCKQQGGKCPRKTMQKIMPYLLPAFWTASQVASMAVMACLWPTDAALQTGWGRRCTMVLSGALAAAGAQLLKKTWHLTTLYRLYEQTLVHQGMFTAWFLLTLSDFIQSALGTNTWAHARVVGAVRGCVPILCYVGLLVLEDGGYRRPPKDWCHIPPCQASESHLESCVGITIYALGACVTAILLTPENRMAMGRRSGLAHVPLALSDIHVSDVRHLSEEVELEGGAVKPRTVTWGVVMVAGEQTGEHVEEGRPGPPVCKQM